MNVRTFKLAIHYSYGNRIEYHGLSRVAVERFINYHKEQGSFGYSIVEEE